MSAHRIWLSAGIGIVAVGLLLSAESTPMPEPPQPVIADIAKNFLTYRKITATPAKVDPDIAMRCFSPQASRTSYLLSAVKNGPHALMAIEVYMNDSAAGEFDKPTGAYPVGSIIVKKKLVAYPVPDAPGEPSIKLNNGVGGMVKRPAGFDPANGDWEYFYFETPASIASGKIASCVQCHQGAKATDRVFGTWRVNPTK